MKHWYVYCNNKLLGSVFAETMEQASSRAFVKFDVEFDQKLVIVPMVEDQASMEALPH